MTASVVSTLPPAPWEDAGEGEHAPRALPGPLVLRLALLAALLVALAGGVSAWLVARGAAQEALQQTIDQQGDEVELVARLLASKIEQSQKVLRTVAASITPEMLDSPTSLEWLLHQGLAAVQFFDVIQVARRDGQLRIHLRHGQLEQAGSLEPAERDILRRTLAQGKPMVSGLIAGRVLLTMPLHQGDGTIMGVLAGGLQLQSQALLPGAMVLPERAHSRLLVMTQEGTILLHPDAGRVLGDVRDEPGLAAAHVQWQAHPGPEGSSSTQVLPGHIVSMAAMPLPQWVVARATDQQAARAPLYGVQPQVAWWVAGATALCALLAAAGVLWLAQPLARLCQRARWAGAAQPAPAWPHGAGEVGALAQALQALHERDACSQRAAQCFRAVLEHVPLGVVVMRAGAIEMAGRQACQLLGYQPEQLAGHPVRVLYLSEAEYAATGARLRASLAAHGTLVGDVRLRRKDGSPVWVRVQGRCVEPGVPATGMVWMLEDLAGSHAARQQKAADPLHDALTQLPNRTACLQRLQDLLAERQGAAATAATAATATTTAAEAGDTACCGAFMHLDLDHFAVINDTAGHRAGDDVLAYVARLLESEVGQSGWVARLAGDVFGVALPLCSAAHAAMVARQLIAAVQAWEPVYGGRSYLLGASIGLVVLEAPLEQAGAVLHAADMACYSAKRLGRNQVVVHQHAACGAAGEPAAVQG